MYIYSYIYIYTWTLECYLNLCFPPVWYTFSDLVSKFQIRAEISNSSVFWTCAGWTIKHTKFVRFLIRAQISTNRAQISINECKKKGHSQRTTWVQILIRAFFWVWTFSRTDNPKISCSINWRSRYIYIWYIYIHIYDIYI